MGQVFDTDDFVVSRERFWEKFDLDWKPTLRETVGAAMRLENTFGSIQSNRTDYSFGQYVEGYDPFDDPIVPVGALGDVTYSRSPSETAAIVRNFKNRERDQLILSQSSTGTRLFGEAIAGVTDPVNLLFGGPLVAELGAMKTFIRGVQSGAKVGLQSSVSTEAILQATQGNRTLNQSIANIFAGTAISAATFGVMSFGKYRTSISAREFDDISTAVHSEMSGTPKLFSGNENIIPQIEFQPPGSRRFSPGVGGASRTRGAAPVRAETGDVPTWSYLDSAQQFMFPGPRTRNSPLRSAARVSEQLVENNTLKKANLEGRKSPQAVESLAKRHQGAMVTILGEINDYYLKYRTRAKNDTKILFSSAIRDRFADLTNKRRDHLSVAEFRREVTASLRSGKAHVLPEVNEATSLVRQMFDDYADDAIGLGLLTREQLGVNYVPRMWNTAEVFRRRSQVIQDIIDDQNSRGLKPDKEEITAQVDAIINSGRAVEGLDESGPRGIFQNRKLDIDESKFEDFLISDIDDILRSYVRVAAVDLELARKFGRVDMADQIQAINAERDSLIKKAQSPEERVKIADRAAKDVEAIEAMRDILRGIYGLPENPYGIASRTARLAMDINNLLMLGGATFASLTDMGRVIMAGGLKDTFKAMNLATTNFQVAKAAANEVKLAGTALDMVLQTTGMRLTGMQDLPPRFTRAESAMGYLTNGFFVANLLSPWNAFIKQASGVVISHKMLGDMLSWSNGKLGKKGQSRLLSAGIDSGDARKIAQLFKEYGETVQDVRMPNTQLWEDLPGWQPGTAKRMQTIYRAALARDVDATVVTPGAGDQPLWTHSTLGRLVAQYKSFGFAAANKVLVPGIQYKDAAQLHGAMMMVFFGGMVSKLRDRQHNQESKFELDKFIVDGIDQSGLLGWYFQANNMIEAITDNRIGVRRIIGQGEDANYSSRYKLGQISPTFSTLGKAGNVVADVITGNIDYQTRRDAMGLIPGRTIFYLHFGDMLRTRQNFDRLNEASDPLNRAR